MSRKEKKNFNEEDKIVDLALRPRNWDEFVGQERIKRNLFILIEAAKKRREAPDHIIFYGPAGLGKTTLAYLVAKTLAQSTKTTSGTAIEKTADLASILSSLNPGEVLFIDEIHRLNKAVEEILYSAMENRILNLIIGKGPGARTFQIQLPPFTLIGATTRYGLLSSPLRSRFGAVFNLDFYPEDEMEKIIERSAKLLNVSFEKPAKKLLSKVSRGTPRVANRLLKRIRDYVQVKNEAVAGPLPIDLKAVKETLKLADIDEAGLESTDRRILETIIKKFNGGPVGLNTLAAATNEEKDTIEEIYEPFLMRLGFIERTPRGRTVTPAAYKYLKIKKPNQLKFKGV